MEQAYILVWLLLTILASVEGTTEYRFDITRSMDFQYPGRPLKFVLKMTIPESTPLKTKVQMPYNTTAIMRLTDMRVSVDRDLRYNGSASPYMSSTSSDKTKDLAVINFGNVVRTPSSGKTDIVVTFYVQVLDHPYVTPGEWQWISVGTEYNNESVWAAQVAVKISDPSSPRPVLEATLGVNQHYQNPVFRDFHYEVRAYHSPNTSAEVENGAVILTKPAYLVYDKASHFHSRSIALGNVVSQVGFVRLEFGKLGFADELDIRIDFKLDPQKSIADGKVHQLTMSVDVEYNGPADSTCAASTSRSRTYSLGKPVSFCSNIYVPRAECDDALGMQDGRIKDEQITASSYYDAYKPHRARLNMGSFWIPAQLYAKTSVNQYLQVNFTNQSKLTRMAIQGGTSSSPEAYVKTLAVYYSNDGVLWTPYKEGSRMKVFEGTYRSKTIHLSIFPNPIVAKYIRIRPLEWQLEINLRLEFYGCDSPELPQTPTVGFTGRSYLLNNDTDVMYVCSIPTDRKRTASTCSFSADKGLTWKGIDNRLLFILGYNPETEVVYGMAANLKTVLQSTQDHAKRFDMIEEKYWNQVRSKPSTLLPTPLTPDDMTVTNDMSIDAPPYNMTSDAGTLWAVSAFGIHVYEEPAWKLRMSWETHD